MAWRSTLTILTAVVGIAASSNRVEAQHYRTDGPIIGYVTVDVSGRYEPLTAPVRAGRNGGREVLVPNWGWTDCGFSCRGALSSHYGQNLFDMLTNKDAPETNILNDLFRLR